MPIRNNYQTITAYRVLPPKWRILPSAEAIPDFDAFDHARDAHASGPSTSLDSPAVPDLLSLILGRQANEHADTAATLSRLILKRRDLTRKQIDDIQWRIDDLMSRRPIHPLPEGKIAEAEKMIIDLERQKQQAEVNEWRDLLEIRRALLEERRAYDGASARWRYLGGYGASRTITGGGSGETD